MADLIYVDNSNVFIEGKRVSAVRQGLALDIGKRSTTASSTTTPA